MAWHDEYPHKLYASVLLDENNEILNWKVGNYFWKEPSEAKMTYEDAKKIEKFETAYKEFTVNTDEEHIKVFEVDSKEWFKNFKISPRHYGSAPYGEKSDVTFFSKFLVRRNNNG